MECDRRIVFYLFKARKHRFKFCFAFLSGISHLFQDVFLKMAGACYKQIQALECCLVKNIPFICFLLFRNLRAQITEKQKTDKGNIFYQAALECLDLFVTCACHLQEDILEKMTDAGKERKAELETMLTSLEKIKNDPPVTFHQALQLFWLFALLAGVINYGRLDDYL